MENKYQILMKTEMGEKEGILDLIEMDGILSGSLDAGYEGRHCGPGTDRWFPGQGV